MTDEASTKLYEAIGLSQAQFANPDGEGLDSGALIDAIDEYTKSVTDALRTIAAQLADALKACEFADRELYNYNLSERRVCPECGTEKGKVHEYCSLAAALEAYEALEGLT